jgi:HK97 family phage portal protein
LALKRSLLERIANKAMSPLGYQVVPYKYSQFVPSFQFFGLTYTFANWNLDQFICNGYAQNAGLYSIVNRITKTASVCPFKVYRIKDQKKHLKVKSWTGTNATMESLQRAMLMKSVAYEEDNSHPLNDLIEQPNPGQRGGMFMQNSIGFRLLTGNKFWFVISVEAGANEGRPFAIYNLPPQYMELKTGGTLWSVDEYRLNLGKPIVLPKESIIHSKYWNPVYDTTGNHLMGLSPLSAGSRNLDRSAKSEERSVAMLRNAGAAGLVYDKTGQDVSEAQARSLKKKLNEEVLGLGNAGKIAVANGDMGYINFGMTAQEMSMENMEKWTFQQLCNLYSVPPGLFDPQYSSYNNAKEFKKELVTSAVIPELALERDDWNQIAKLYPETDIYVDYDINVYPEMQEDFEKTSRVLQNAWWFTGNERRLAMGSDEDKDEPNMDRYLVPQGLLFLDEMSLDNAILPPDAVTGNQGQANNQGNGGRDGLQDGTTATGA